jgi:hypothetical protein
MTITENTGSTRQELEHGVLSRKALLTASLVAAAVASLAILIAILPAEYGIDPTGMGAKLGLTTLNQPQTESDSPDASKANSPAYAEDSIKIVVPAGDSLEYKFQIGQYDAMKYAWKTNGGSLFFDFHGEPQGNTTGFFESYAVSTASGVRGTFTAPFAGSHGWYWKNKSREAVTVTLTTGGQYTVIGRK